MISTLAIEYVFAVRGFSRKTLSGHQIAANDG
jgi:hypothetical protein